MKKIWEKLNRLATGRGNNSTTLAIPGFLSWNDFNHRVIQERSRSDRSNSPFTLVSFSLNPMASPEDHNRLFEILASVIRDRTRKSDIKGLHGKENKKLGMILPNTDFEKAAVVVRAVETKFHEALQLLKYNPYQVPEISAGVFIYPADKKKTEAEIPAANPTDSKPEAPPPGTPSCPSTKQVA